MKSVTPEQLAPHRSFFTEYDRYGSLMRWGTDAERDAIRRQLDRKLKLLLITKAHTLIAASQLLESPFAHDLLRAQPELVSSGAIVSSIKLGHESTGAFLEEKRHEEEANPESPYHSKDALELANIIDEVGTSVRWPLAAMSDWFRERLADDLADDHSLIRLALRREGIIPPQSIVGEILDQQGLSRGDVDRIVSSAGIPRFRDVMRHYADFIYYLAGARATGSQGVLPQENLVDFSIGELIGRKTRLSDNEIFFKIFMDLVKAKTSTIFPSDFLDSISISDALELRNIATSKHFTEKYNLIQVRTMESLAVSDPEKLVLFLEELDAYETDLYEEFSIALDRELPTRLAEEKKRSGAKVVQALASIFIPFYSPESYKELAISGLRLTGKKEAATAIEERIKKGLFAFETAIEAMDILEKQVLLDFVDIMKKKYQGRMFKPGK